MPTQAQVNSIQLKAGILTFDFGLRMLRDSFKDLNARQLGYGDITNILKANSLTPIQDFKDLKFWTTNWTNFQYFFENVLITKLNYIADRFDCDDYARLVSALTSVMMLMNTAGEAHCQIYNKNTGVFLAGHFCNLVITADNEVFVFDLDNKTYSGAGFVKYEKGKKTIIGDWEYREFDRIIF